MRTSSLGDCLVQLLYWRKIWVMTAISLMMTWWRLALKIGEKVKMVLLKLCAKESHDNDLIVLLLILFTALYTVCLYLLRYNSYHNYYQSLQDPFFFLHPQLLLLFFSHCKYSLICGNKKGFEPYSTSAFIWSSFPNYFSLLWFLLYSTLPIQLYLNVLNSLLFFLVILYLFFSPPSSYYFLLICWPVQQLLSQHSNTVLHLPGDALLVRSGMVLNWWYGASLISMSS